MEGQFTRRKMQTTHPDGRPYMIRSDYDDIGGRGCRIRSTSVPDPDGAHLPLSERREVDSVRRAGRRKRLGEQGQTDRRCPSRIIVRDGELRYAFAREAKNQGCNLAAAPLGYFSFSEQSDGYASFGLWQKQAGNSELATCFLFSVVADLHM